MAPHRRAFHLHIHQRSDTDELAWSVTRSLWTARNPTRSAFLGTGLIKMAVEGGTPPEVALAVLRAAVAQYEAMIRAGEAEFREV